MNKKLFFMTIVLSLILMGSVNAHQATMHQYITREAFKLLQMSFPGKLSEMNTFIGITDTINPIDESWGAIRIVSGAWIEDQYDVVYHYGIGERPNFNQEIPEWYFKAGGPFFPQREAFTTITHFWNADGGPEKKTHLSDDLWDGGHWTTWSYDCENALQKIRKYLNGDYDYRWIYKNGYTWIEWGCYDVAKAHDFTWIPLLNFYNGIGTIKAKQILLMANPTCWFPTSCPEIEAMSFNIGYVYEILGRMCHLLQDMSVPAHAHCTSHACSHGMYCDYYENNELNYDTTSAEEIWNRGERFINPFNEIGDPIYFLMYFMNQIADHYADGKKNGDDNYPDQRFAPYLNPILPNLGPPTTTDQINYINCRAMYDVLMPFAIRATAGLMYWFAKMTNQLPTESGPLVCNETWGFPHSLTGNVTVPSGITLRIKAGANVSLDGHNITSTGGTIIIESGATINSSNSHVRLTTGSTINGLYPTIASAMAAASSGQTIEIYGPHTLTANYLIPSGLSLSIKSGATVTLGSYSIVSSGGTLSVASGATVNPYVHRKSGSTLLGLYPSILSALSVASSGQTVEYGGSHTMSSGFTVPTGITLVANAGSTLSFPGYYYNFLVVNGTLNISGTYSNRATFTRSGSSGAWGGIRYQSGSSGSIQYANINNATYGVYANNSSPNINNTTISNCSYGIYAYSANPDIRNNTISNCTYGIYLYNSNNAIVDRNAITACTRGIYGYYAGSSDLTDNLITSGGSSRVSGIQVYSTTEPNVYNNTIEGSFTYCLDADHYSRPLAIGPGSQNYQGYNRMIGGESATIYAHDHSEAVFGTGFTQSTEGYAGYNTIYLDIGTDKFANVWAQNYSNIIAQKNYWGSYPPEGFYADGTSSIDYRYALSSDPGGGSSLGKMVAGLLADALSVNIYPFADVNAVEILWQETTAQWQSLQYRKALENCNTLLQNYPNSPYAPLAFLRSVFAKRALKSDDLEKHIEKYLTSPNLRTMALELLIGEDIQHQRLETAIQKAKTVISENPDTEAEYKALFTLFNIYAIDLGDREKAQAVLNQLKAKYADYSLTQMAQFEMGEAVDWRLAKPIAFRKQPAPPATADILPDKYQLKPNYPNPFNPTTNISFALPEATAVQIRIFDLTGREIWRSLRRDYPAGNYTITWNGVNQSGESVVSGIYIVRMITPKYSATQRIVLLK